MSRRRGGHKHVARLLREPGLWCFRRGPELLSRLMGDLQTHLDKVDRLLLLDTRRPLLLPLEAASSPRPLAGKGARMECRLLAQEDPPYRLVLDVNGFAPEELSARLEGRKLTVFGKHEKAAEGEDGCVSREYREVSQEVLLPADASLDGVACALDHDGRLRIEAPRLEHSIPIAVSRARAGEASEEKGQPEAAGKELQGTGDP